ncbi:MAG: hypothetical protein JW919_05130 [Candidatus Omnitrophica bacterium]|nr:hypothetical protein [Candidatus Omnitrophota bacterium]
MPVDRSSSGGQASENLTIAGKWNNRIQGIVDAAKKYLNPNPPHITKIVTPSFLVHAHQSKGQSPKKAFGAALNLKYHAGLNYEILRRQLPGKTMRLNLFIPHSSVRAGSEVPNRIRISIKSEKDKNWGVYTGESEWHYITRGGNHTFFLKIPENETNGFDPENMVLVTVEYFLMDGVAQSKCPSFLITDCAVSEVPFENGKAEWQFMRDGYVEKGVYAIRVPAMSAMVESIGNSIRLEYSSIKKDILDADGESYVSLSIRVPEELRNDKGYARLVIGEPGYVVERELKSHDLDGNMYIAVPVSAITKQVKSKGVLKFDLSIHTKRKHMPVMMPFLVEPPAVRKGRMIPFDNLWTVRDIQGLGGYRVLDIRKDGKISRKSGISVKELGDDLYSMEARVKIKGGIDWNNPYYRVELMRPLAKMDKDLSNNRIEMIISPVTDTLDFWQKPYRARIGVLDNNDRIMFGPNVSLSEGLPSKAFVDVTLAYPMPKGFTQPGFDPKNIKAIVVNIEGSHKWVRPVEISVMFEQLVVKPLGSEKMKQVPAIDYSRFSRTPDKWQLTAILKKTGGYAIGVNYPFPHLKIPPEIMEVPHAYPSIGKKPQDVVHVGFGSSYAQDAIKTDFTEFASREIEVVRIFLFGHCEGVFTWDMNGGDITGFTKEAEDLISGASGLDIESYTEFLRLNEKKIFPDADPTRIPGLEQHVVPDMFALFDALEEIERSTGKQFLTMLALYDFLLGDGISEEGPMRRYSVGEHPELVTDAVTKAKAHAIVWKLMKTLQADERFYRYTAAVEVINEPFNATALVNNADFPGLVSFVGETLYILKDAIGPKTPVTIGFRSWPNDLGYWKSVAEGIDILTIHYWYSLESYNIDKPGLWPLDMPADRLWEFLGTEKNGRLTIMSEISARGAFKNNLSRLEKAGYDMTLPWSYSGHDGHSVRPVMAKIQDYQNANVLMGIIGSLPSDVLQKAFSYLVTNRMSFESANKGLSPADAEKVYMDYLDRSLADVSDPALKDAVTKIARVAQLTEMPLSVENVVYLKSRVERNITQPSVPGDGTGTSSKAAEAQAPLSVTPAPVQPAVGRQTAPAPSASGVSGGAQKRFDHRYLVLIAIAILAGFLLRRMTGTPGKAVYGNAERRVKPRFAFEAPVICTMARIAGDIMNIPGVFAKNISESGMLLYSPQPISSASTILVNCNYKKWSRSNSTDSLAEKLPNTVQCEVVRSVADDKGGYSIGVKFLFDDPAKGAGK